jgi:hypothetical protein
MKIYRALKCLILLACISGFLFSCATPQPLDFYLSKDTYNNHNIKKCNMAFVKVTFNENPKIRAFDVDHFYKSTTMIQWKTSLENIFFERHDKKDINPMLLEVLITKWEYEDFWTKGLVTAKYIITDTAKNDILFSEIITTNASDSTSRGTRLNIVTTKMVKQNIYEFIKKLNEIEL